MNKEKFMINMERLELRRGWVKMGILEVFKGILKIFFRHFLEEVVILEVVLKILNIMMTMTTMDFNIIEITNKNKIMKIYLNNPMFKI